VWPYADLVERSRIRAAAVAAGVWPPKTSEFIVDMRSEIFEPMTSVPVLEPGNIGPYYEIRSYQLKPGGVTAMAARWDEHLPNRTALSPLAGAFHSDIGALNQWMHIWAYKSLDERFAVRKEATAKGIWPPPGDSPVVAQSNKIVVSVPFSPMQ